MFIRFFGSFSNNRVKRSLRSSLISLSNSTSSIRIAWYSSIMPCFSNGIRPNSRQYSVQPMDQMSAALPETWPCLATQSSGGMNAGDPADFAVFISPSLSNISETPKSTILSTSSSVTRQLSGLMSRWMIPCAWTGVQVSYVYCSFTVSSHTVFKTQYHVSQPTSALLFAVRICALLETDLHDHAFLAHLHDHVQRVLLWVVEHFD